MDTMFVAATLGLVEGLTEFLPISSSGHLVIASSLLGFEGEKAATFGVVIQVGAILAVLTLYWRRFFGLLRPQEVSSFSGLRGILLLILTTPRCVNEKQSAFAAVTLNHLNNCGIHYL